MSRSRNNHYHYPKPLLLSMAVAACFATSAIANPAAPIVVNGTASFNQTGNVLTVTNSNGTVINWQQFSIAAGETTHFAQASASSQVLNRVLGGDPSAIYGTLSSNGRVWLVNPAGIMVGPSGRIDVAGFVASTLNVSTADFLANKLSFNATPGAGTVTNQGEITTPSGGAVYLIGTHVTNEGIITTPQGETILAAGQTVSLIDTATPGVKVEITGAEGNATNLGAIVADAGRIGIAGVIVRNSGTLNASSAVSEGGKIFLRASQDAYVDGNGRIVTTGTTGGSVEVLGDRVAVMDNASIDASGASNVNAGGGKILVGGDYQGNNPAIQNASITYFGPDASLKADAQNLGAGGTVIVWADDTTRAFGTISARGGANGGNGGFVETSGHRYLAVDGIRVDTRAPQGQVGTWLLDPSDMAITAGGGDTAGSTTVYGSVTTTEFTTSAGSSSTISDTTINTMLASTDVIIHTGGGTGGSGNITADGVNISNTGGWALILAAYGGGTATGNIDISNSFIDVEDGITLLAGWNGGPIPYGTDGQTLSSADVIGGKGNITIQDSTLQSFNTGYGGAASVWLFAGNNIDLKSIGASTQVQADTIDVVARGLTLTAGNSGSGTGRVELFATDIQNITINNGGLLQLQGGSGGNGNSANLEGGTQNITFYGGGTLNLYGGSGLGSFDNHAKIGAMSGDQVIHAEGVAITLTGGGSGGTFDQSNDAGIHLNDSNGSGSQTVYAGSITINGGSAAYGGAGFGVENGNNQSLFVTGNLTMNGGSSANSDFLATPVYIGSEYGGGTINVNVDGSIFLNGGSSLGGGVLIGSVNDFYCADGCDYTAPAATSVTLNAGKGITATGNTGGVWLGVKDLTAGSSGSSVVLNAGWDSVGNMLSGYGGDITTSGPVGIQVDAASGGIQLIAEASSAGAYGGISLGAGTAVYGSYIDAAAAGDIDIAGSLMATGSSINLYSGYSYSVSSSSQRGGNLTLESTSNLVGNGIDFYAQAGTSTPYGGGTITQAGTLVSNGYIDMYADRDLTINGSVTSDSSIYLYAGSNATDYYGGNLVFGSGSTVAAGDYLDAYAYTGTGTGTGGYITQYGGGASIFGSSGVYMVADRDLTINGSVTSDSSIYLYAGSNATDYYGGNLVFGSGSTVAAGDYLDAYAYTGTGTGTGGYITQYGGGASIFGSSGVYMDADRDLTINGSVTSDSYIELYAGYNATNYYGGSVVFGSASQVAAYGGYIDTYAYSGAESRGDIVQYGGSIYSDSGIDLYADGSIKLNGRVETPSYLYLYAGLDNYGESYYNSFYGGDILLGAGSAIYGADVHLIANRGTDDDTTGNITQLAGGSLNITGITSLYAYAAGSVELLGATVVDSGAPVDIEAGYDYPGENSQAFQDKHITINSLNALGSGVHLHATGSIFANTLGVDQIDAGIENSNSGGIVINNSGAAQPSSVGLQDNAVANSAVSFTHTGSDLTLDSNYYFSTNNGSILVAAPLSNLTYTSGEGGLYGDSVILAAGNNLNIDNGLYTPGDLSLIAGNTLNINNYVQGNDITLTAPTINVMSDVDSYGVNGINFVAGNLNADGGEGGFAGLHTYGMTGNITGLVADNIMLSNGAHFRAGDDISLTLTGASSELALSNGAYLLSDDVTQQAGTTYINFTGRSSGGIFVNGTETTTNNGATGFFVLDLSTPAVPDSTLLVTYSGSLANQAILAILDSNTAHAGETEEERQRRLHPTDDNGEHHDPADKPVAQCS